MAQRLKTDCRNRCGCRRLGRKLARKDFNRRARRDRRENKFRRATVSLSKASVSTYFVFDPRRSAWIRGSNFICL